MTNYNTRWQSADGRRYTLEEMTTNHLLNCYQHIKNNLGFYYGFHTALTGSCEKGWKETVKMQQDFKTELLSRNVSSKEIENWKEQMYPVKTGDYAVRH